MLAYGQAGTYSREDAESILGKSLSFSDDKASFFGDQPSDIDKVAANPVYKKTVISKSDFVKNNPMTLDKLGIKADSISEITVSDSKGIVSTFLIKDDNTLIIFGGGTYFDLLEKPHRKEVYNTLFNAIDLLCHYMCRQELQRLMVINQKKCMT